MSGYRNGDEWRWRLRSSASVPTIAVIEPPAGDQPEEKQPRRKVPFGFGRVIAPPPADADPLLWEGED